MKTRWTRTVGAAETLASLGAVALPFAAAMLLPAVAFGQDEAVDDSDVQDEVVEEAPIAAEVAPEAEPGATPAQPVPQPVPPQPGAPVPAPVGAPAPTPPAAAPPPVILGSWNAAPTKDQAAPAPGAAGGEKFAWAGTAFTWNQSATTTALGIGRDNIGDDGDYYGWDFSFKPNYTIWDAKPHKFSVNADLGWETELTNSPSTTTERETLFKDLQLGTRYGITLYETGGAENKDYVTGGNLSLRFGLPTSKASSNSGKYLTTSLGAGLSQKIPLLGKGAAGLNDLSIGVSFGWTHLFSRATTATNDDLDRPRQNLGGKSFESDQLSSRAFAHDGLSWGATLGFPVVGDLSFSSAARLTSRYTYTFSEDVCVETFSGECLETSQGLQNEPTNNAATTLLDVSLSYPIFEVVEVALGYANISGQLGEDGLRRNFFYSPDAQFYLDITANLDVIYQKTIGKKSSTAATKRAGSSL